MLRINAPRIGCPVSKINEAGDRTPDKSGEYFQIGRWCGKNRLPFMPVRARRHVKKMRGGAQAHLIECDDGGFYVVKYLSNPQHRRILPNEWIASVILRHLQIAVPEVTIVDIPDDFVREFPEASVKLGSLFTPPDSGWHFGSKYPGDPRRVATYDFVPDQLLPRINNLKDFLGVLAFDKWTGNTDGRQAVFFRAQTEILASAEVHQREFEFVALMIDQGYIFNGPHWDFNTSPVQGLYSRKMVYNTVRSIDDFQPWLDRVVYFPDHIINEALRSVPPQWILGDGDNLEKVIEQLMRRCKRVPDLIADSRLSKTNPFANWQAPVSRTIFLREST